MTDVTKSGLALAIDDWRVLINDDWPGIALLRSRGEMLIDETVQLDRIRNYFSHYKPRTAHGALKFAQALLQAMEESDNK